MNKTILETYKGFNILIDNDAANCNIVGHDGVTLNKNTPYYSVTVEPKQLGFKHFRFASTSGYSSKEDTASTLKYIKGEIDKEIQYQLDKQKERIQTHKDSKIRTFILNNVTINVIQYGNMLEIYVNEKPLRHPSLPANFSVNDVLANVHTKTIAQYNVTDFSRTKTNFYKNRETTKFDFSILPAYELLGFEVKLQSIQGIVKNVRGGGHNEIRIEVGSERIEVSPKELQDVQVIRMETGIQGLGGLMNRFNFYE